MGGRGYLRVLLLIACLWSNRSWAQSQTPEFTLAFSGSRQCDDRAAFVGALHARVSDLREAPDAAWRVVVEVSGAGQLALGKIKIRGPAISLERRIPAARCAQVLDSMALILALVLEERSAPPDESAAQSADLGLGATSEAGFPTEEPVAAVDAPAPKQPAKSAVSKVASPRERQYRVLAHGPRDRSGPSSVLVPRIGVTSGAETRTAASPVLLVGAHLGVEAWFNRSKWSPTLRLEGSYGTGPTSSQLGAPWDFRLKLLRLLACPLRYRDAQSFHWRACAVVEAGELEALSGARLEGKSSPRMVWGGAGAALAIEVPILRSFSLDVSGSSLVLFKRGRFLEVSRRADVVNEMPPVSVGLTLGTVVWFD